MRNKFTRKYFDAYHCYIPTAYPEEDYDDRNALHAMYVVESLHCRRLMLTFTQEDSISMRLPCFQMCPAIAIREISLNSTRFYSVANHAQCDRRNEAPDFQASSGLGWLHRIFNVMICGGHLWRWLVEVFVLP